MKVINPIEVTNDVFVSSNVTEDDYTVWTSGATFSKNGYAIVKGTTHKVFQSVQDNNTGHNPVGDDGTWWIEISATNRWKAFDKKLSDQVVKAGEMKFVLETPSIATGLALLNAEGAEATITVKDGLGTQVYTETRNLVDDSEIVDWFTFFTSELDFDTEVLFTGLPAYSGHTIEVEFGNPAGTGTARLGQLVIGKVNSLGRSLDGTSLGIEDFSSKDRDSFGNAIITERAFAQTVDFRFAVSTGDARRVFRFLASLRAKPAVYFADESIIDYGATVYGFYQDFDIPLSVDGQSFASIEIESLT